MSYLFEQGLYLAFGFLFLSMVALAIVRIPKWDLPEAKAERLLTKAILGSILMLGICLGLGFITEGLSKLSKVSIHFHKTPNAVNP